MYDEERPYRERFKLKSGWILLASAFAFTLIMCLSCNNPVTANRTIVFPDSNVTYQEYVQPFLSYKCAYSGCHSSTDRADDRDMSNYFALSETSNAGLVIAYQPDQSRLVTILKGNPPHAGYFTFQPGYFSDNEINGISTWIKEGAKLN